MQAPYPTIDESLDRLHRAGWSIGHTGGATLWLVSGTNGENVRHVTTQIDPRATREEVSVRLLGRPTYLKAKAGGENSMWGKAGCSEAAKRYARQGPDGTVKAALLEPQCPLCKPFRSDTADDIRCHPEYPGAFSLGERRGGTPPARTRSGGQGHGK